MRVATSAEGKLGHGVVSEGTGVDRCTCSHTSSWKPSAACVLSPRENLVFKFSLLIN